VSVAAAIDVSALTLLKNWTDRQSRTTPDHSFMLTMDDMWPA